MFRQAARPMAKHARSMSNAAPAVNQGIFEAFFSKSKMPRIPMDVGDHALAQQLKAPRAISPDAQSTVLENGVRVVTMEDRTVLSSVGVFVDSGSRYESAHTSGISHFLEHVAFKSTVNNSAFVSARNLSKMGTSVACSASREHTFYSADCLNHYVEPTLGALSEYIQDPLFDPRELAEARADYAEAHAQRVLAQPDLPVIEMIHAAAYSNTLGNPLFASEETLANFTPEALTAHMNAYYIPSRMVVAAVGVDHENFVEQVKATGFAENATTEAPTKAKAEYVGGLVNAPKGKDGLSHLAIAFETAGFNEQKDLFPMCVLQQMLGGGDSFSSGGPGKGMCSRLYQNVLKHDFVASASSFNSVFTDSAIFGIYATAPPQYSNNLADVIINELNHMAGPVTESELRRAKNGLKSAVLMQLESRVLKMHDLGTSMLIYNKIHTPDELCEKIDAVSAADIQRVAGKMLKTAPSVATIGANLRYDMIERNFQ